MIIFSFKMNVGREMNNNYYSGPPIQHTYSTNLKHAVKEDVGKPTPKPKPDLVEDVRILADSINNRLLKIDEILVDLRPTEKVIA